MCTTYSPRLRAVLASIDNAVNRHALPLQHRSIPNLFMIENKNKQRSFDEHKPKSTQHKTERDMMRSEKWVLKIDTVCSARQLKLECQV